MKREGGSLPDSGNGGWWATGASMRGELAAPAPLSADEIRGIKLVVRAGQLDA